jgi:hypothetical protein
VSHVHFTPSRLMLDGEDITESVKAWRVETIGRDVPTVVLELKADVDTDDPLFVGLANVRIARDEPGVVDFLNSIDPEELNRASLETGDMSMSPMAAALEVLKGWAVRVHP